MSTLYAPAQVLWQRTLERVAVTPSGCWIFQGSTNSRGYGLIASGRRSKNILVHRLAVIVRDGSIPDGLTVDHQCHDSRTCLAGDSCLHRRCVNPSHLRVMGRGANSRRRWEQLRQGAA